MVIPDGILPIIKWVVAVSVLMCCSPSFDGRGAVVEASHVVCEILDTDRSSFLRGQYRTGYHFQPPMNFINDPNAPMYYNGIYHFFYQYNPKGQQWGNIIWAHSVSTDMVNWIRLAPAIYPSKWFDINGCWSGAVTFPHDNTPVIMYTGIDPTKRQVQIMAVPKNLSDPFLQEWVKPDYNPVIIPDSSINASVFRDPTTAWYGPDGYWRLLIGNGRLEKNRGVAILYKSKDFVHWVKARRPLHSTANSGNWECPDFFPVLLNGTQGLDASEYNDGMKHILKISLDVTRFDYYTVGKYYRDIDKYVPDNTSADNRMGLRFDYGNFYASKTFFDLEKRRRILWSWSNESDTPVDDTVKGWAGIQTIPRSLWLDSNGRQVIQWPIEELKSLRMNEAHLYDTPLDSGSLIQLKGIQTAQADAMVTFDLPSLEKAEPFDPSWTDPQVLCSMKGSDVCGGIGPFGLLVLASGGLEEQMAVFFRVFKAPTKHVILMCHDSNRSSLRPGVWKQSFGGFVDFDIQKEMKISLRSLIDNSVVESFGAEGRTCITSRVYPILAIGAGANLFAFNNGLQHVKVSNLTVWEMMKPRMNGV